MTWTVIIAKPARKQLARFPAKDQARIQASLQAMVADPFSGDIIRLEGEVNRWRRRVGNYRIFFAVEATERLVGVSAILRRTTATY